ncbi:hypothetical protein LMG26854_00439 [Achromobacter aegrifaciens]|nr:hypothetical protein LMG26854_00439 [Achromobacter aegrifaciens]
MMKSERGVSYLMDPRSNAMIADIHPLEAR